MYREEGEPRGAKNAAQRSQCPAWRDRQEGRGREKSCNLQVSALHFNQRVIYSPKTFVGMNYIVMVHKKAVEGRRRRGGDEIKEDREGIQGEVGEEEEMDNISN